MIGACALPMALDAPLPGRIDSPPVIGRGDMGARPQGTAVGDRKVEEDALELKDIRAIVELMRKNDLTVFEMERDKFRIKIERETSGRAHLADACPAADERPAAAQRGGRSGSAPDTAEAVREIVSPMVGTLYRAPAPEAPPFVEVGDAVTAESVVCIIEAMKVMNEIRAEIGGVIAEVLVENGKPVQYGQPLFRLR